MSSSKELKTVDKMNAIRERLVSDKRADKLVATIYDAALDEEHRNQAPAWKILMDRLVPVSTLEAEAGKKVSNAIQINISTVGAETEVIEHES